MYITSVDSNGVDSNIAKVNMIDSSVVNDKWSTIPNTTSLGKVTINGDSLYVINGDNIVQISLADGSITNVEWFTGLVSAVDIYSNLDSIYVVALNPVYVPDLDKTYQTSIYVIDLANRTMVKHDPYVESVIDKHVYPMYFNGYFYNLTPLGIAKTDNALHYAVGSV
jgi:hypothetical protein